MPVLRIEGLRTTFPTEQGRFPVVDQLDLTLEQREVLALVGESGCGKSMTALSLLRLVPRPGRIEAGQLLLADGRDLATLPVPELRRLRGSHISMIFQDATTSLNPVLTIGAQLIESIRLHRRCSRDESLDLAFALLARVGLPDARERLRAYPHQLSGGMKQRVMIAMALASRPKLLIADEPTTALDVTIQAQILELLREVRDAEGMAILLITHDLGVVNELADRVAVMYAGRIVELGQRETILAGARHPYTQGLLRSIPALAPRGERLREISGTVPTAQQWPPGCRFAPRCPLAMDRCRHELPPLRAIATQHAAACHLIEPCGAAP